MPISSLPLSRLSLGLILFAVAACGPTDAPDGGGPTTLAAEEPIPAADVASWIDLYLPARAAPGLSLVLYRRRTPMLIDGAGRIVHAWPDVRAAGRARLLADGGLLFIDVSGAIREVDWGGESRWEFRLEDDENFPHHDVIRLENGNRLVLARDEEAAVDFLVEVDEGGAVVWSWHARDHLTAMYDRSDNALNRTHINSVHELPPNRHYDAGDERFRPGNILVSVRNMSTVLLIDRPAGDVVWETAAGLDYQHEAIMIPPDQPGAGNILLFNNRFHAEADERRSAVQEIDPATLEVTWTYEAPTFYSSTGGAQQPLENGNVLITSSRGGRVFEVTRRGEIVWQWAPPFQPMRAHRVAADFTPQLRALKQKPSEKLERRDPRRHVDEELYEFVRERATRRIEVQGKEMRALFQTDGCADLLLPSDPEMSVRFGARQREVDSPTGPVDALFRATLFDLSSPGSAPEAILEHRVAFEATLEENILLGREKIALRRFANRSVRLCLAVSSSRADLQPNTLFWTPPLIRQIYGPSRRRRQVEEDMEEDHRARQLKALGYVD